MNLKSSKDNYGLVGDLFHWIMAAIIIGLLAVGIYMVRLPLGPEKINIYGWHKSFGILVLSLVILRILWRLGNKAPALPNFVPIWQKLAAHSMHFALYIFMIAMPLTGWLMSSSAGFSVSFFKLFTLPNLVAPNDELRGIFNQTHKILGYLLIAAIIVHVGATLQHYAVHKHNLLKRMRPW